MKTFAIFYEANLPKGVEQLPDGTYRKTRQRIIIYALDPKLEHLHRIDGPAVESKDRKAWYVNGERHRIDGPAVESKNNKEWWVNDKLHRIDGPAIVATGYEAWFVNGKHHRIGGPAVVGPYDMKQWYVNGKRHRIDGPAFESKHYKQWWVDDKQFTEDDYNHLIKRLSTLTDDSDKEATIAAATMFD